VIGVIDDSHLNTGRLDALPVQSSGISAFQTGQNPLEVGGDAESAFGAWTNADERRHGGIRSSPQLPVKGK
jgi:hypothetical protein